MKRDPIQTSANVLKGKIGENIVLRLFGDLDYHVFYNGYEITHPAFMGMMRKKRIEAEKLDKYRVRADFTLIREKTEEKSALCFEVEVKFRASGEIAKREVQEYDDDVRFIFVDQENFWSISKKDLFKIFESSNTVKFDNLALLEDDRYFDFSSEHKAIIREYKSLISQYLRFTETTAPATEGETETTVARQEFIEKITQPPLPKQKAFPENHGAKWRGIEEHLWEEYCQLIIKYSFDESVRLLHEQFDRTERAIRLQLARMIAKRVG